MAHRRFCKKRTVLREGWSAVLYRLLGNKVRRLITGLRLKLGFSVHPPAFDDKFYLRHIFLDHKSNKTALYLLERSVTCPSDNSALTNVFCMQQIPLWSTSSSMIRSRLISKRVLDSLVGAVMVVGLLGSISGDGPYPGKKAVAA
ncbi:hypothetical protein AVEN_250685-1 [Araneus ventricosus]|uniref:Uncharacterized protein n=1 Tax=Araneus ventricosus TaxID=182803 RepID=A0A4Y2N2T2_ARAVE|nr:hypothetical protein AVEN_250685-1 [Araneus ventricosus]